MPEILFFLLGICASLVRAPLELPSSISRFLSLYLLMNIGLRGGVEIHKEGFSSDAGIAFALCILMSCAIPIYTFYLLKRTFALENAAAVAASYGSVSLITFVATTNFLNNQGVEYGGFMVASMALMEAPAIIVALVLYHLNKRGSFRLMEVMREAFFNPSVYLLLGALVIGAISGEEGWRGLKPFSEDIFKGFLSLFLLDMGITVGQHLKDWNRSFEVLFYSIAIPIFNGLIAYGLSQFFGLSPGNSLLFILLCSSASYIAVPAAMRLILPDANPSIYVTMALAFSFPFNLLLGLPLFWHLLTR